MTPEQELKFIRKELKALTTMFKAVFPDAVPKPATWVRSLTLKKMLPELDNNKLARIRIDFKDYVKKEDSGHYLYNYEAIKQVA